MFRQFKRFVKEKILSQKKTQMTTPTVSPKEYREAAKAAKERANGLKVLGKDLPGYVRTLDGLGDFMDYTANELDRYGTTYVSAPVNYSGINFVPSDFMRSLNAWSVPRGNDVQNSIVTLSGVGTSVTGSVLPQMQRTARPTDNYFANPPANFIQLRLTDELTPLLDQLNLTPTWKSAWENLVLERDDSLKNACVNARTVVDEISWMPDTEYLKTLDWCELDKEGRPIRAVRYAWIRHGDVLPESLGKNCKEDTYWKTFGQAYSELGKFVHKAGYDATSRTQVEVALKSLELGLIVYLEAGMTRLLTIKRPG
jgi:hypothetical protein